jgi:hypothetical protein
MRSVGPRINEVFKGAMLLLLSYEAEIRHEQTKQRKEVRKRQRMEWPGNNTDQ